jgi:fucose 4-O-acetylase-like acetyltransferase
MTSSSERRYDLDWLRVLGVLLLIPFHVALIFVLQPYTIMYIRDVVNSPALSVTTGFIHMWHMPMLFMISGSATYFALGFRSAGQYIRERFLRLFIPLIFGLVTYVPFTIYIQHSNNLPYQPVTTGWNERSIYARTSMVHPVSVCLFTGWVAYLYLAAF